MKTVAVKPKRKIRWKKVIPIYILMLPALLYFFINNYLPMFGVIIAFKKVNYTKGLLASDWCGFDNFKFLFTSGNAWMITRNTLLYNILFIILGIVLGMTVAILMNEIRGKIPLKIYQTVILLPYLMSWVVVSYLAFAFLSGETGFINNTILPLLGSDKTIAFYQEQAYWPFILTFVNLWKSIGFNMIIYYSGIIGIPNDYFEAARVDGASKWQQIRKITIPCMKSTIITLFILNMGRIFYSDFGLFYQVPKNSGLIYNTTQTIDTFVYNTLMRQNNLGMSAAASFFQSIVGCALVIAANQIVKKLSKEDALF